AVVHADQSGNGQEGLAGYPDANLVRSCRPRVQRLPPSPVMPAEVTVETAGSPGIGRKRRQRGGWIRACEVNAVVAEEDPVAVCRIGVASQVRRRGSGDLHAPA